MKVTVLVEDTGCLQNRDLVAEHGLSLHIDWNGRKILFDAGATEAFGYNAEKLGIDIREIDFMVLSHHHYDHGGGLAYFLEKNQQSPVYLGNNELADCYFRLGFLKKRYVGLDKALFQRHEGRFEYINEFREIFPNVFIMSNISRSYPIPGGNRYLFIREKDHYRLDEFNHELMMVLVEKNGLLVFSGCSHQGILNMIKTVVEHFKSLPIKALFGGFHLVRNKVFHTLIDGQMEIESIGQQILRYPIQKIYTGHCTAAKAFRVLKKSLREKLDSFSTGRIIELK